jgi:hypothetical protein
MAPKTFIDIIIEAQILHYLKTSKIPESSKFVVPPIIDDTSNKENCFRK